MNECTLKASAYFLNINFSRRSIQNIAEAELSPLTSRRQTNACPTKGARVGRTVCCSVGSIAEKGDWRRKYTNNDNVARPEGTTAR